MLTVKLVRHDIEFHPMEEVFAVEKVTRLWNQDPNPRIRQDLEPIAFEDGILCTMLDGGYKEIPPTKNACNKVYVMNEDGKTVATYYL